MCWTNCPTEKDLLEKPNVDEGRREALSRRRFFNSVATGAIEAKLVGITATTGVRAATQEAPDGEAVKSF